MRTTRVCITLSCSLFLLASVAGAQSNRKSGLWEMTSTTTWQKSPLPPGMTMPAGANNPFGGGPQTRQVCLTQAIIDKYGAPMPQSRSGDCTIQNVAMQPTSMSADWVCNGRMSGKGTIQSSWTIPDHAVGKVHFVGVMQMGPNSAPVEFTVESSSVYKGPDCGSVQPIEPK